jgi:hypothetical protein
MTKEAENTPEKMIGSTDTCPYCKKPYRVTRGNQRTCGQIVCMHAHRIQNIRSWRKRNPQYA